MSGRACAKARLRYWATNSMSIRPPATSLRSQASLSPFSLAISARIERTSRAIFAASALAHEHLPHRLGDVGGEARVSGDDAGARQRHVLPGLRLVALIEREGGELGRERPLAARGPQPHVDLVELARLGRRGQRGEQALGEARVIERRAERLRAVRTRRRRREIVDHDEVEIGGRRHLARAELAHRDDGDASAADSSVLGREGLRDAAQARADQALRERAVGLAARGRDRAGPTGD